MNDSVDKDLPIPVGEEKISGHFNGVYLDLRIRPSYKFVINCYIGGNPGSFVTMRKESDWYEFKDANLFSGFPPSPFGLSLDYFITDHWGSRFTFL
jgi:hypothetical protein